MKPKVHPPGENGPGLRPGEDPGRSLPVQVQAIGIQTGLAT
jgi:hypothetical protein